MKKLSNLLLILLVGISGCATNDIDSSHEGNSDWLENHNLTILTPTGAPILAFLDHLSSNNYETNTNVANITASMVAETYDMTVVDLVGGLNVISKGANYSLGAIITFGNFYIYSTGNDDNQIMENEDNIVAFGNNTSTPIYIFNELYNGIEIDTFVAGASDTLAIAKLGEYNNEKVDYVITAEPVLTQVMSDTSAPTYNKGEVYSDFQEKWTEKFGVNNPILGAAIFVKNSSWNNKRNDIIQFLANIQATTTEVVADPEIARVKIENFGDDNAQATKLGMKANLAEVVLAKNNAINLGYLGYDDSDFTAVVENYLPFVNVNLPSDSVYLGSQ